MSNDNEISSEQSTIDRTWAETSNFSENVSIIEREIGESLNEVVTANDESGAAAIAIAPPNQEIGKATNEVAITSQADDAAHIAFVPPKQEMHAEAEFDDSSLIFLGKIADDSSVVFVKEFDGNNSSVIFVDEIKGEPAVKGLIVPKQVEANKTVAAQGTASGVNEANGNNTSSFNVSLLLSSTRMENTQRSSKQKYICINRFIRSHKK